MTVNQIPEWSRLENAAKIFPPSTSKRDTKVFRFSCQLTKKIEPEILQMATEEALQDFPFYRSILKQGLFWYYFEASELKPKIHEENMPPCVEIYHQNKKGLLFEVTYYHTRINLEIFHALTDGTGALQFLQTIIYYYLKRRYPEQLNQVPTLDYDASTTQKAEDSFLKYYQPIQSVKEKSSPAYQLRYTQLPEARLRVIEGICSAKGVLKVAHQYDTTLTVYLTAAFFCAIAKEMPLKERKKPVTIAVPVNLRNYFASETSRNFFSVINIKCYFGLEDPNMEDVIPFVKQQFHHELTKERISAHISNLMAIEKNIFTRLTPLFIKKPVLRIAHYLNRREATASISNIGRIKMPKEFEQYIDHFEVFVSTTRIQACICSYQDQLSISFTSPFKNTEIQKNFFRILTSNQISVKIISNLIDKEDE